MCKFQSGPPDQGGAPGSGREICKSVIRAGGVKLSNPSCSLDVDPVVQIEVCMICMKVLVCM